MPPLLLGLILGPAIASAVTIWFLRRLHAPKCKASVGELVWEFSKSWASTLTVALGLYPLLVSFDPLPASPTLFVDKSAYSLLAVLFAGLVAAAPLAFLARALPATVEEADTTRIILNGDVCGLTWSVALLFWAVIGQMLVAGTLTVDLIAHSTISPLMAGSVGLLSVLLLGLAFVHSFKVAKFMFATLEAEPEPPGVTVRSWLLP